MTKRVAAYFKSENDAESVHAKLHSLDVDDIRVEEMPEDDSRILIPVATAYNSGATGNAFASGTFGFFEDDDEEAPYEDDNEDTRSHLLEFEVSEEDYEKALNILKDNDGYVDQDQFKQ